MADESFQNEIPPSRVNIRYLKDVGDAKELVELPQRVLVVGDFSFKEDDADLEEVKKISVDNKNFNQVMESMDVGLDVTVANKLADEEDAEMQASLKFKNIKDFRPESIVEQVPELDALAKIRGLLNDLKARLINNREFRKELEKILKDAKLTDDLVSELSKVTDKTDKNK